MSQTKITRRNRLGLILKLLIGVGLLLFTIAIFVGIPGVADLPRTAYNYSRRSPVTIMWNGVEFRLPPPWFRLAQNEQIEGTVTFFRDQFPWAERQFSLITFKPPFPNDFAANPENGLQRWEQLNQSLWSTPIPTRGSSATLTRRRTAQTTTSAAQIQYQTYGARD